MKKRIGILVMILGLTMFSACGADSTKSSTNSLSSNLTSTVESEGNTEMNSETVSLTEEETKLQAAFDKLTNNGETATIIQVEPSVYELHNKISWSSALEETPDLADFSYTLIEEAVTEAYGEHDPITVRIYDENGKLVATNENSENYWEMQEVE